MTARAEQHPAGDRGAARDHRAELRARHDGHRGRPSQGNVAGSRGSSFYRVVSFFPYTVPAIVIGLIWARSTTRRSGLLNGILTGSASSRFESFAWLGDERDGHAGLDVRDHLGLRRLLHGAVRRRDQGDPVGVSTTPARMDGAGRFRIASSITIPLIRDTVQTAYIYLGILALDAFVYMAALNPGGGPDNSTLVMPQHLFNTAFAKGQFGLASAMGVVMAVVTLVFAAIVFTVNRLTGGNGRSAMSSTTDTATTRPTTAPSTAARAPRPRGDKVVATRLARRARSSGRSLVIVPLLWTLMSSFKTTQGDLRLAVRAARALELRQLRQRVDDRGHRQLLPQHGHRGRLRPRHRDGARVDVRLRARLLLVPRRTVHLLPDARRPDLPDLGRGIVAGA